MKVANLAVFASLPVAMLLLPMPSLQSEPHAEGEQFPEIVPDPAVILPPEQSRSPATAMTEPGIDQRSSMTRSGVFLPFEEFPEAGRSKILEETLVYVSETYRQGQVLRWQPLLMDDLYAILQDGSLGPAGIPVPVERVELAPFSGTTIIADNASLFVDESHGYVWEGRISQGGSGDVTIFLGKLDPAVEPSFVIVVVNSDAGSIAIKPIDVGSPHYVAIEFNRHFVRHAEALLQ